MREIESKRTKRRKKSSKGWKFWVLFVAVPIIFVLVSSIAFYGLSVKKKSSKGKQGVEKGLIYVKLNRYTDAIAEFKKGLEKDPENANIYYYLGLSYIKLKEYEKAIAEIKTALRIKPSFSDARAQLVVIKLAQAHELRNTGKRESLVLEKLLEAEDECRETIDKDPSFVQAYTLLSEIHFSQGLIDDAIIDYRHALKMDNSSVNGHIALARLYTSKGDFDMARKEYDLVLSELDPGNLQVQILLSTIYEQQGNYEEAVTRLNKVLKSDPKSIFAHIQLGLIYLKTSRYDEAYDEAVQVTNLTSAAPPAVHFIKGSVLLQRKEYRDAITLLRMAIKRLPKQMASHYFLALALVEIGRVEAAKTEFKIAIDLAPEFIPAKIGLARLLSSAGWQKEVTDLCVDILETKPDNVEARQMLGLAYVRVQDYDNAEKQFEKLLALDPSIGDFNMAYLSFASGQLSKCIRQCEAIISTNPEEARVYDILGLAHIRRGNVDLGIEQLKKSLEKNPNSPSTLLNLAKACVITEKSDDAKEILKNIVNLDKKNLYARTLLAGIYKKESKIDEAAKVLEQVIEIDPDYIEGYSLASMYLLQGKTDESIDLYKKALKLDPENPILFINLALSYQQKENYDASVQYCKKAIGLKPKNTPFNIFLTNCYLANGKYGLAKENLESISSLTFDQKKVYFELLGLCKLNNEKAKQIALAMNKAIFTLQGGLFDLAIIECKKAIEIFPESIVPKVILANTYLRLKRNEEAIAVYSEVIKEKPEFASSYYYDMGRAYLLSDKPNEAISMYQNMLDLDSESVSARLAMAGVLIKKGDTEKAGKMIEGVIELDPENLVAHDLLGRVSMAGEDFGTAEVEFTKMIELRSGSFEAHFNLARMKFTQGDFDGCIEHCKEMLVTRPVDVRIHNMLGMSYMRKRMLNDAEIEFNKIIDINSDFLPAYLNLAKINMTTGKPDIALFLFKAALKIKSDAIEARLGLGDAYALMGKHSNAVTEFESIVDQYPNNVNAHISLARTFMAMDDYIKAQEAALNALSIEANNPIARSVLAKIYVQKEDVPQAITQLKRMLSNNPKVLNGYELGVLYMDVENYPDAVLTYKQGTDNFPENKLMWCSLAIANQMTNNFNDSRDACLKALSIQPDGILPNMCMLNLFLAKGEFGNAKRHLVSMTKLNDIQKNRYLDLVEFCNQNNELAGKISYHLSRAIAYTSSKWFGRILQEYDEVTKIAPTNTVAYYAQVDNLILIGEDDKAISICEKIIEIDAGSPVPYNKLASLYYRKGETDKAIVQYRNSISVDPKNFDAYLNIGVLLESKDLLEESIGAYKKAIELNPTSPVAYNNLAWLYASRMQDKIEEALGLANKAKEIIPDNPAIIDTLGWIYYLGGMYDKALSELKVAARNATWDPTIRYHLGMAYYKKGLKREALVELERALKINDTFPEADEAKMLIEKIILSRVKGIGKEASALN